MNQFVHWILKLCIPGCDLSSPYLCRFILDCRLLTLATYWQYWHQHMRNHIPHSFFDECPLAHSLPFVRSSVTTRCLNSSFLDVAILLSAVCMGSHFRRMPLIVQILTSLNYYHIGSMNIGALGHCYWAGSKTFSKSSCITKICFSFAISNNC